MCSASLTTTADRFGDTHCSPIVERPFQLILLPFVSVADLALMRMYEYGSALEDPEQQWRIRDHSDRPARLLLRTAPFGDQQTRYPAVRTWMGWSDGECRGVAMDRPAWAPEGVDLQQASPARMYDALLGGSHNFEIDRKAAEAGKQLV